MYNRYIPGSNGVYKRIPTAEPQTEVKTCTAESGACSSTVRTPPTDCRPSRKGTDIGDMLILCIVILLLLDSDGEDMLTILIAAVAFIFLQ